MFTISNRDILRGSDFVDIFDFDLIVLIEQKAHEYNM